MSAVVRALARFEGRRLVRHPALLTGLALALLASVSIGGYIRDLESLILTQVLVAWGTLIAVDLAVLRSRRRHTDELLASLPCTEQARLGGHLLSTLAAASVSVVALVVAVAIALAVPSDVPMPPLGPTGLALLIVIGGGAVGVAVARWLPHVAFGYLAVWVTLLLQGRFGEEVSEGVPRIRLAFLYVPSELVPGVVLPGRYLLHALYLASLIAVVAVVALARRRVTQRLGVSLAAAVAVAVVAAGLQMRPLSTDQAAAIAAPMVDPQRFQTCQSIRDIEYCAYPDEDHRVATWAGVVQRVLAGVPDRAHVTVERVTQRALSVVDDRNCVAVPALDRFPRELGRLLPADTVWADDGQIHPGLGDEYLNGCNGEDVHHLFLAVQTGSFAVGLPPALHGDRQRCVADGQARSALALWLGARAVEDGARSMTAIADDDYLGQFSHLDFWGDASSIDRAGWSQPPPWGTRFHRGDLDAARRLLTLPDDDVVDVVAQSWPLLVDPATPTSDLLRLAGLEDGRPAASPPAALEPATPACR